jgi:hypothetical protein
MSVDIVVFLRDDQLPSGKQLQAALDEIGTQIILDETDDLRAHTGFLPATHKGEPSGFEWSYGQVSDYFGSEPPAGLADRGNVVNFVLHSDMRELYCALATAAALAKTSDGLMLDDESGDLVTWQTIFEAAASVESGLG